VSAAGDAAGELRAWLAPPEAAGHFDPGRQSSADAARWQTLRAPARRREWAASRALLAHLEGLQLASASLSHSGGWCAALTAPAGLRVGVDLERVRARDEVALARWAFAAGECDALGALHGTERRLRFYVLWTLKEACAKALGLGLLSALRDCEFHASGSHWRGYIPTSDPWQAWVYAPRPGLVLAVVCAGASASDLAPPRIAEWPADRRDGEPEVLAHVLPGEVPGSVTRPLRWQRKPHASRAPSPAP
jgi:4'-phosphopantetheinyl transferase